LTLPETRYGDRFVGRVPTPQAERIGRASAPAEAEAKILIHSPGLPASGSFDDPGFALIPPDPNRRVRAFSTLRELARAIHDERGGEALQLLPERIRFRAEVRDAVAVFADDPEGGRRRLIGHAWIGDRRDWRSLAAMLDTLAPVRALQGRSA
jgi:hypothetical protein